MRHMQRSANIFVLEACDVVEARHGQTAGNLARGTETLGGQVRCACEIAGSRAAIAFGHDTHFGDHDAAQKTAIAMRFVPPK